jgi:hypothetical protein
LPEIPATASGVASTDDDDDDDEGHYDVISKSRRLASLTPAIPVAGGSQGQKPPETNLHLKRGNHPYEKVRGDPDSESATYAGIPDCISVNRRPNNGIPNMPQNLQAGSEHTGPSSDPLYAGVGDDDSLPSTDNNLSQPPLYSTVGARAVDRPQSQLTQDIVTDAAAAAAASSVTPPVPDRRYELRDFVDGVDDASVSVNSSLLPLYGASAGETGSWTVSGFAASSRSVAGSSPGAGSSLWSTTVPNHLPASESAAGTDAAASATVNSSAAHPDADAVLAAAGIHDDSDVCYI